MAFNSSDEGSNSTIVNDGILRELNSYEMHRIAAPELLVMDRVITPIFYFVGLIGNPLSAKIWLSKKVRKSNSSAIYLGSIAIVHTIFICIHIWMELLQAWGIKTFNRPNLCEVFMVLAMTVQYLTPLLILGFTFERFIAICFPFLKAKVCTVRGAVYAVVWLTLFALAIGLLQAYLWSYNPFNDICDLRPGTVTFNSIWTWASEMLIFVGVPLTVLVFNILVIREIKRMSVLTSSQGVDAGRGTNHTSTVTLLSVSFYLICTLLPATIVFTIQSSIPYGNSMTPAYKWVNDESWAPYLTYYHIRRIIEEICMSNYACYVFIYYATSTFFRENVDKIYKYVCNIPRNNSDSSLSVVNAYRRPKHVVRSDV